MQAYIAVSYNKRKILAPALNAITKALQDCSITGFVFVNACSFLPSEEKQMMEQAFREIDNADLFIAEVSDKAIGIGIETGYARAKNKPIIYLRHVNAEHSTTMGGTSDATISYYDTADLKVKLADVLMSRTRQV